MDKSKSNEIVILNITLFIFLATSTSAFLTDDTYDPFHKIMPQYYGMAIATLVFWYIILKSNNKFLKNILQRLFPFNKYALYNLSNKYALYNLGVASFVLLFIIMFDKFNTCNNPDYLNSIKNALIFLIKTNVAISFVLGSLTLSLIIYIIVNEILYSISGKYIKFDKEKYIYGDAYFIFLGFLVGISFMWVVFIAAFL